MSRFLHSGLVRGLVVVAVVSLAIVLLSLEESLATAGALLRIAFLLAITFFLFLVWRERRAEIEAWSDLSRRTFYCAIVLAVATIGVYLGIGANGPESVVLVAVLGACAWAVWRVWRREHRYS